MAEGALVVYRGQLHTERSRVSYLLEAFTRAFGDVTVAYLAPPAATPAADVEAVLGEVPGVRLGAYLDGRLAGATAALRAVRALQGRAAVHAAIGSTSIQYLWSGPGRPLVWCVNGVPEERLMLHDSAAGRFLVRGLWASAAVGRRADLAVVVSRPMAELVSRRTRARATFVAPCCVERPAFSPPLAAERRFVTYLGSAAPWQDLDQLARVWAAMHDAAPGLWFRAVSTDPRAAVLGGGLPVDAFELTSARQPDEVAALLWEASLGCLIRRPHLVNRVASPMKAGEYLAAGVPLAVSRIGWDVQTLVEETGAGSVLEWGRPVTEQARALIDLLEADLAGGPAVAEAAARLDRRVWVDRLTAALLAAGRPKLAN